ncbi:MAG: hypothetical protein QW307_01830 [Thermoplasmata archaeon]
MLSQPHAPDAGIIIKTQEGLIDRQKNAAKNIWNKFLSMWGVVGSPRKELSSMKPPMNPEEDKNDEAQELSMDSIHIHT